MSLIVDTIISLSIFRNINIKSSTDRQLYSLRLFDNDIMIFSMTNDVLNGLQVHIIKVFRRFKHLLPPDLELNDEGLRTWLKRRIIPKNRAFVGEILRSMGLRQNDTKGIIEVCKGLSLNDSYWVVPLDFNGTFSEYNLYHNRFSEILSLVAYTGAGRTHEAFTTSPEFTTQGMLRKAWRKEKDGIYLYKGGTEGFINAGLEPPRAHECLKGVKHRIVGAMREPKYNKGAFIFVIIEEIGGYVK